MFKLKLMYRCGTWCLTETYMMYPLLTRGEEDTKLHTKFYGPGMLNKTYDALLVLYNDLDILDIVLILERVGYSGGLGHILSKGDGRLVRRVLDSKPGE